MKVNAELQAYESVMVAHGWQRTEFPQPEGSLVSLWLMTPPTQAELTSQEE